MNNVASRLSQAALLTSGLMFTAYAQAHFPILECRVLTVKSGSETLSCQAGYSDGSVSGKVTLAVKNYDEEPIAQLTTASDGTVEFNKPSGEFYIVFDPGHESPAEFDYAELE